MASEEFMFAASIGGIPSILQPGDPRVGAALAAAPVIADGISTTVLDVIRRVFMLPTSARFTSADGNLVAGQATFAVPGGYSPGMAMVFRNGVILRASDYTATDGAKVVLAAPVAADEVIDIRGARVGSVVDAAPIHHQHEIADVLGLAVALAALAKAGDNTDIARLLGPNSGGIDFLAGGAVIAGAATVDLGSVPALKVGLTGTTTITSFGTLPHRLRFLRFHDVMTLTHNATSLIVPGGSSVVTAAGDTAIVTSDASGNWTVRHYQRANGYPLLTPMVVAGNTGATSIPAGATRYVTPGLVNTSQSLVYVPAGRRGRFRNLRVITPGSPGTGESWTFTLQKLFSDTALTCTIGAGTNQAADLVNSVPFEANERWCLKVASSAGAAATSNILFSMLFEAND